MARIASASVGTSVGSTRSIESSPCSATASPVKNDACDGTVHDPGVTRSQLATAGPLRTASDARNGVVSRSYPHSDVWSARTVSITNSTTVGRPGPRSGARRGAAARAGRSGPVGASSSLCAAQATSAASIQAHHHRTGTPARR